MGVVKIVMLMVMVMMMMMMMMNYHFHKACKEDVWRGLFSNRS